MAYSTRNSACVASKEYDNCSGDLIALNKLKGWVDLATRQPVTDREDGAAASEKAIIKSRLKIPFWVSDDQVKNTKKILSAIENFNSFPFFQRVFFCFGFKFHDQTYYTIEKCCSLLGIPLS